MTAESLRAKTLADLEALGFRPAHSLPPPDLTQPVRPPAQVAARLMALDALFTWVAFPEKSVATARVQGYLDRNHLRDWLTVDETAVVALSRGEAHQTHVDNIGWRLENMWALAWVLGFEPEPDLEAAQIGEAVSRPLIMEFLPGLDSAVDALVAKATPREAADVIAMAYRFYCAHNAVRSAQLGRDTVPAGFHPIRHGGAVHERRHSLSWCIAPDVAWEDTDLST